MATHILLDSYPYSYYVLSMKTTIEINDVLISQIKKQAREKSTTMKELMESALVPCKVDCPVFFKFLPPLTQGF